MIGDYNLALGLMNARLALSRPSFELAFFQLQNTTIRRINKEIGEITERIDRSDEVAALEKEINTTFDLIDRAEAYKFGNESNLERAITLGPVVTSAISAINAGDSFTALTDDEATTINGLRDDIVAKLKRFYVIKHPNLTDGRIIEFLLRSIDDLEGLTAVAGIVDAEGTETVTNENRPLLDLLNKVQVDVNTTATVTQNSIFIATGMIIEMQPKVFAAQAEISDITALDALKQKAEIEKVKQKYATFLSALSLSFETSQSLARALADNLSPKIPLGSIMNIFS